MRNVTDIDDKILAKAAAAGRPWWEWAATHERAFHAAYDALGCLPPSIEPRATGHVTQMVELMERLIERATPTRPAATSTSPCARSPATARCPGQKVDDVAQGEGEAARKRDPLRLHAVEGRQARRAVLADAVGSRPARLAPGVLGDGHHYLGPEFDIHGGGLDLVFPHHENERAQSQRGRRRVRPVLAAQRLGHHGRREDVQVAGQHAVHRRAAAPGARGRAALLPGRPALPLVDRVLGRRAGGGGGRVPADRVVRAPGAGAGRHARSSARRCRGVRRGDGRRPGHARGAGRDPQRRARGQHRARRRRPQPQRRPRRRPCGR